MPTQPLETSFIAWVAALLIAPPLIVLILTEVIVRVSQQSPRLGRTIALFRNVVLPLLLIRLILQFVLGMHPTDLTVVAVETVFLLVLLYALLALLDLFIQGLKHPAPPAVEASAPSPSPNSFQLTRVWGEALRILTVVGIAIYLLNVVWGVPLNQIFVVLGGALVVLAIALQETLNSIFAGLLLAFEKPFEVGHWIRCGPYEGRILEMNWRSIRLSTRERDIVVLPNRLLTKEVTVNYSLHDPLHAETIQVSFPAEYPPNQIKEILREVTLATPGVIPQPPPQIRVQEYQYSQAAIQYQIKIYVDNFEQTEWIRDEILTRLYYAARRHKLSSPLPSVIQYARDSHTLTPPDDYPAILETLKGIGFLTHLSDEQLTTLAHSTLLHRYGRLEQIVQQGRSCPGLYYILSGQVELTGSDGRGQQIPLTTLKAGDVLGESALLRNQTSPYTAIVEEDLTGLFIERASLVATAETNLRLAKEMNRFIEQRQKMVAAALSNWQPSILSTKPTKGAAL
jgi:small-conductance mechanosensitive channel